jgi:hypothetical protein
MGSYSFPVFRKMLPDIKIYYIRIGGFIDGLRNI